ncbi:hypothetical protein ACFVJ4_43430 [Streptomyces sp. NPDC127178]|uniref:hypothetical protein n=1 Tax=unclassified Streptomyces TaxID=2593676 RepID=UPI003629DDDD
MSYPESAVWPEASGRAGGLGFSPDHVWQSASPDGGEGQYTLLDQSRDPVGTVDIHVNGMADLSTCSVDPVPGKPAPNASCSVSNNPNEPTAGLLTITGGPA